MESQRTMMSQAGDAKCRPATLTSRLANSSSEPAARNHLTSRQPTSSPGLSSSNGTTRRPSSSGGPGSRPSTPTGRSSSTLTTNSRSSSRPSTPTSRTTTVSSTTRPSLTSSRSTASATTKPTPPMSRSTSSSRLTPTASKPTTRPAGSTTRSTTSTGSTTRSPTSTATRSAGPRSTTPLSRSTARSSTPTSRPTLPPPSKAISRSSTPTRRPSAATTTTSKPSQIKPSSPAAKPMPTPSKTPAVSRAPSPTVRSRPWKPSDMPGFSLETPPNLRTTLPERPLSATRGRPGAPSPRSNSVEPGGLAGGRPRRQSCSPSRGRAPMHASGSSVPAVNRGYSKANDNVSPVLMGAKMVERVINMRKLAPPRSDEKGSPHGNLSAKSSSPDSAGFGRSLSKKSLDMAIRHMDIRRTIPGNLRPLMTNIPASSMYSVRSGHTRGRPMNVSDSPLATSSNASSEISAYNNNGMCLEAASEKEDDAGSERGCRSPASLQGR